MSIGLDTLLERYWHPVATVEELESTDTGVTRVRLLGRDLAVARLGADRFTAMIDRCPHRSTRLSVGRVDAGQLRCAYHGWTFDSSGRCTQIPALGEGATIPPAACVDAFRTEARYGLVWVLLDDRLDPPIPACPAFDDPALRVLMGPSYVWPTSPVRRVENFVDLAHFAWVHDGSLGDRSQPVPPLPELRREDGELRFEYVPPELDADPTAMFGYSRYRMPMPLTVNIDFEMAGGIRRTLWMTASPIDLGTTRSFWMIARSDELDPSNDAEHFAFQFRVLEEDEPVVCNQVPAEIDLTPGAEVSVRTDRVSIEYRRWLRDLMVEADVPAVPVSVGRRP